MASFFAVITVLFGSNVFAQGTLPAKGSIDSPKNSSTINGQTVLKGWFLDGNGVSKVQILVDGKAIGSAQYGFARNDIAKAYPSYKNSKSGYQYGLDTTLLTNGKHSLTVRETAKNGETTTLKLITVNVQNLPAKGSIDAPGNGSTISGQSVVNGWFLDGSGVSKVEVLVDGKTVGTAKYGIARNDIVKVYPQYKSPNSGYQYMLDTTQFTNGKHTLTVKEIGKNSSVYTLSSKITVNNSIHVRSVNEVASIMNGVPGVTTEVESGAIAVIYNGNAIGTWGTGDNLITLVGAYISPSVAGEFVNAVTGASASGVANAINSVINAPYKNINVDGVNICLGDTDRIIVAEW